jgi:hypothetical protein
MTNMGDLEKRYMEFSGGVAPTAGAYDNMRAYILEHIGKPAKPGKPSSQPKVTVTKDWAWKYSFYPEYAGIPNLRERFARIASDHAGLNYDKPKQIQLFSLNGYFDAKSAAASAHTFTTCGLFVRACRAAALILEQKSWKTNTSTGTDACIVGPSSAASIRYDSRGGRVPRRGDIFHVATKGKNNDHVGIILNHLEGQNGSWLWTTVEGGQGSGYETRKFDRILPLKNGHHIHGWDDHQANGGRYARPVVKWIDLDLLAAAVNKSKTP